MNRDEMRQRARARSVERLSSVLFDQTAQIVRPTSASDGMGGETTTYPPLETIPTVPCRVTPGDLLPREELGSGPRLSVVQHWILSFPAGTDVQSEDRIVVGGSRTFEVIAQMGPRSDEVRRRVACVEVS